MVEFAGREEEIKGLIRWRDEPGTPDAVLAVQGSGGHGKTRLAMRFAELSAEEGWAVATVRHRSEIASAGGTDQHLEVGHVGLMLVVDYADRWPLDDLLTLIRQHRDASRVPVRILLLTRPGTAWWQGLAYQLGKINITAADIWSLPPLARSPEDRAALFETARLRFAELLPSSRDPWPESRQARGFLAADDFQLVLTIHMAALAAASGAHLAGSAAEYDHAGLVSYVLDRERDYWTSFYAARSAATETEAASRAGAMARIVYSSTLTGPHGQGDAIAVLRRGQIASDDRLPELLADHRSCYPPVDPARHMEPLYPDRLGEDFVALQTPGHQLADASSQEIGRNRVVYTPDPWARDAPAMLLGPDDGSADGLPAYAVRAVTVLTAAAQRWQHLRDGHLYPLLRAHPLLAVRAGSAVLASLAAIPDVDAEVLEEISAALPPGRDVGLDVGAAAITEAVISRQLALAGSAAGLTRAERAAKAELRRTLAYRLGNVGREREALAHIRDAAVIYRQLAEEDTGMYLGAYAATLLSLNGKVRPEEALDTSAAAVDAYKSLRAAAPDRTAGLASALGDQAIALADDGQLLAAIDSDLRALKLHLGLLLPGMAFGDDLDGALEIAGAWRGVAGSGRPDSNVPSLTSVLGNLASHLSDVGRHDAAVAASEECLAYRRWLAKFYPRAADPDIAITLLNFGLHLARAGRWDEAVDAAWQAVVLYRKLYVANPAGYETYLLRALNQFSVSHQAAGRDDADAAEKAKAAAAAADELWENKTGRAASTGDGPRLRAELLTDLMPHSPEENMPLSAGIADQRERVGELRGRAARLIADGAPEAALTASTEAIAIVGQLRRREPLDPQHSDIRAGALYNQAAILRELGRFTEAAQAAARSAALYHGLAAGGNPRFLACRADALARYGSCATAAGQPDKGIPAGQEAVAIYRTLTRARTREHGAGLARSLGNLADALSVSGVSLRDEAIDTGLEAATICRHLGRHQAGTEAGYFGSIAHRTAARAAEAGRWQDALLAAEYAIEFLSPLAQAHQLRALLLPKVIEIRSAAQRNSRTPETADSQPGKTTILADNAAGRADDQRAVSRTLRSVLRYVISRKSAKAGASGQP